MVTLDCNAYTASCHSNEFEKKKIADNLNTTGMV